MRMEKTTMTMTTTLSLEEKWDLVREHYEEAYHVRFHKIPDPKHILMLYEQMLLMFKTEKRLIDQKRLQSLLRTV